MLTTFDVGEHVYDAFRAGATGVAGGDALLAPAITRRLIEWFVSTPRPADDHRLDQLTDREPDMLRLVAHGLSNAET